MKLRKALWGAVPTIAVVGAVFLWVVALCLLAFGVLVALK